MNIITKMKELDKYDLWDDKKCKEAKFDGMDGIIGCDLLKELRQKPSLWQEPLVVTEKCLLFKIIMVHIDQSRLIDITLV